MYISFYGDLTLQAHLTGKICDSAIVTSMEDNVILHVFQKDKIGKLRRVCTQEMNHKAAYALARYLKKAAYQAELYSKAKKEKTHD